MGEKFGEGVWERAGEGDRRIAGAVGVRGVSGEIGGQFLGMGRRSEDRLILRVYQGNYQISDVKYITYT
jgi:hypothetical protein